MMYTVSNISATSATLSNLQCNTNYTIWVYASGGQTGKRSVSRMVFLPPRGKPSFVHAVNFHCNLSYKLITTLAPPTPTEVTAQFANTSTVRVAWQWASSGPAPDCFNTTTVTYRPEGGGESSLQLSDPAATAATLTDLQCNTNYTITVVATAGVHRSENMSVPKMVFVPPRSMYIQ